MSSFQLWLVEALSGVEPVTRFMTTRWGWPAVESIHFMGLTLLLGSITLWDLRLVGMAKAVPIAAFHRLVPLAVLGLTINAVTGSMFLMTEPRQYVYNPAFQFKMLLLVLAGLNVALFYFYAVIFRRVDTLAAGTATPVAAKICGAASLVLWIGVILFGRLITFYRPFRCRGDEAIGFILDCVPR